MEEARGVWGNVSAQQCCHMSARKSSHLLFELMRNTFMHKSFSSVYDTVTDGWTTDGLPVIRPERVFCFDCSREDADASNEK